MKITILEPKGYCAGVARAIDIALKAKKENMDKNVYILGMLVHNHHVSKLLESHGVIIANSLDDITPRSVIVFNADGHTSEQRRIANEKE